MLEHNWLFRHSKGDNPHIQNAEMLETVLIAAAVHVECAPSSKRDEEYASYIADLCGASRYWAEIFRESVHHVVTSRALNKEQFRMLMIELIGSWNVQARLLLPELLELEAAAKRRKKARSAVILPFQPRPV